MQGKKKKILHFISGLEVGGAETQLLRVLPGLQKFHENRVCCVRGRGPVGKELSEKGIKVYYLDLGNIFDLRAIFRLRSAIKSFCPDIMVTYLIHADLYGRVLGKIFGVNKIVCSKRGALLQWEWLAKFDWLTKCLVSKYLVQTEVAKKEWMERVNLPAERFTVIPNGIDAKKFKNEKNEDLKKKLGISSEEKTIICVANLHINKGHKFLLRAFESVFQKNPKLKLLLVGDGAESDNLQRQIENYASKDNILFLGRRNDVPKLLGISDIFVLPTMFEGMSNAVLEAMACGLPIITTNILENRELIKPNKEGILVPVNDAGALSKNIWRLLENEDLATRLGKSAKEKVILKYSIERVTRDLAEFFTSL